ncbi:MAG: Mrp/NBP35 family ATP-binding protein [Bacteroidetes bacterium]|nr:Mrp/NBP35 family ATP-binding protein [Bacteroidota bacterium]
MTITKEKVLELLEKVLYFPKGDNVVALNMIRNIKVEGDEVSFVLYFPKRDEHNENILKDSCINAIKQNLDENVKVNIDIKTPSSSLKGIKNIVAIASGKGGVGKSTVAVNLAVALHKSGERTGIVDADIYGPSIPMMFDVMEEHPQVMKKDGKTMIIPIEKYGIKVLSIGFFVDKNQALIWRGPLASNALTQLFNDADWGELDYLVVDLPPGTGDIHLTLVQQVPVTGVAIVTTPQEVALADAKKAFSMFNQKNIKVPVLGLIENMSFFTPAELPENKYYIFGKEGGKKLAKDSGVVLLGEIPLVQSICESGDNGKPSALEEGTLISKAFMELANNIKTEINKIKSG